MISRYLPHCCVSRFGHSFCRGSINFVSYFLNFPSCFVALCCAPCVASVAFPPLPSPPPRPSHPPTNTANDISKKQTQKEIKKSAIFHRFSGVAPIVIASSNRSIDQLINQSINQLIKQSVHPSMIQSINQRLPINQSINHGHHHRRHRYHRPPF